MKHATLPQLRNDAMRRYAVHSGRYSMAEIAYFRAQVHALRSLKDSDEKVAAKAKQSAWHAFLPFEECLNDLTEAGMQQEAARLTLEVSGRIRRGRFAFLEHRGFEARYADLVPVAIRLASEGGRP